jgi:hypothetical protein
MDINLNTGSNGQVVQPRVGGWWTNSDGPAPGVSGQNGPAGDAPGSGMAAYLEMVMDGLCAMMPKMSVQDIQAELTNALTNLQSQETSNSSQSAQGQEALQQALMQAAEKAAQQAQQQQQQAQQDTSSSNIWSIVGAALQMFFGLVLTVLGAAVAAICPPAGALIVGMGALSFLQGVNSVSQIETGSGIEGNLAKAFGANSTQAGDVDIAFNVMCAVTGLALAAVGFLCPAVAAAGVTDTITTIADLTDVASSVTSGVTSGGSAYWTYESMNMTADSENTQGTMTQDQAQIDAVSAIIKQIGQLTNASLNAINAQFSGDMRVLANLGTAICDVKFA